jgi:hypothetical protein
MIEKEIRSNKRKKKRMIKQQVELMLLKLAVKRKTKDGR